MSSFTTSVEEKTSFEKFHQQPKTALQWAFLNMNIPNNDMVLILLAAIIILLCVLAIWHNQHPYAPQRIVSLWDDVPYDDPRHPQRRDVGAARTARWLQIFVIWGGIIPGIVVALLMTIIGKFTVPGLNSLLVSVAIALLISVGIFQSFAKHFLIRVSGNYAIGVKKELGQQAFDDEGFPLLGFFFSGVHPKFFWETEEFATDLSRDVLVTENDIPGHNSGGPIQFETSTGVSLQTSFSLVIRPDLWYLQNLYHAGGEDADKVVDERTGRTRRDQFLAKLFAADAAERLSEIFANLDAEYIRTHKRDVCRLWWEQYAGQSNDMEVRHGTNAGQFIIANTDYDPETGNRRRQEAGMVYDNRAIDVHLKALGLTTDPAKWGRPIEMRGEDGNLYTARDASGNIIRWQQATEQQLKDAREAVQLGSGKIKKVVTQVQIPALEGNQGESIGNAVTAFFSAILAARSSQQS